MIKHIVLFQLKDKTKKEETKAMLLSMIGKLGVPAALEVGTDFLCSDRSYDVALSVTVESRAALDAYQNDPYHAGTVKPYMHAARSASVSVDYEY